MHIENISIALAEWVWDSGIKTWGQFLTPSTEWMWGVGGQPLYAPPSVCRNCVNTTKSQKEGSLRAPAPVAFNSFSDAFKNVTGALEYTRRVNYAEKHRRQRVEVKASQEWTSPNSLHWCLLCTCLQEC